MIGIGNVTMRYCSDCRNFMRNKQSYHDTSQTYWKFVKLKERKWKQWQCLDIWFQLAQIFTIIFLLLLLGFCFDWEDVSNTWDSDLPHFQTARSWSKMLHCGSYFQCSPRCLEIRLNSVTRVMLNRGSYRRMLPRSGYSNVTLKGILYGFSLALFRNLCNCCKGRCP